VLFNDGVIS